MFNFCDRAFNFNTNNDKIDLYLKDLIGNELVTKEMVTKFVK